MKTTLIFVIAVALSALASAQDRIGLHTGGGYSEKTVGDVLWNGKYYRAARAHLADGVIEVRSGKDGVVSIPLDKAPAELKARFEATPNKSAPATAEARFHATEEALSARYGVGLPVVARPPATKAVAYKAGELRVEAQFWNGRAEYLMITKYAEDLKIGEAKALIELLGGTWQELYPGAWQSPDKSSANFTDGKLIVQTRDFNNASNRAKQDAARETAAKNVKGF